MNSDIAKRIIELAAQHAGVPVDQVTPAHHFVNDLEYDSLTRVEFAMDVEDELEVSVPDEDLEQFQTVGQVIEYVERSANAV